jgi:hypothetical protein
VRGSVCVRAIAAQKNAKIETQDRARSATSMKTPRIVFSSFLALVALVSIGGLAIGGLQRQCRSRGLGGASMSEPR